MRRRGGEGGGAGGLEGGGGGERGDAVMREMGVITGRGGGTDESAVVPRCAAGGRPVWVG